MSVPGAMRPVLLALSLVGASAALAGAADTRLGLMGGGSLLEQTETALIDGPATDDVTLGRSLLGGLSLELGFGRDRLAFEGAIGPYHDDVWRTCFAPPDPEPCVPEPFIATSHVVFYGMHYRHVFGDGGWRPLLGLGLGVKKYSFKDDLSGSSETSPTFEGSLGAETAGRTVFRVETRGVYMTNNPLISGRSQFELQVRASVLFALGH